MKKISTKTKLIITVCTLIAVTLISVGIVFAATNLLSRGTIEVTTIEHVAETSASFKEGTETTLKYTTPGEEKSYTVTTKSKVNSVLQCYYTFSVSDDGDDNTTALNSSAILVYLQKDGYSESEREYLGTLAELSANTTSGSLNEYSGSYVKKCTNDESNSLPTASDVIIFQLHNGADGSALDGKNLKVTINAWTRTADYEDYIYVEGDNDLKAAVYDINSGIMSALGTYPTVVLLGDATFFTDATISNPFNVDLNGHKLSGSVTLNDTDAYLWCTGNGTNSATVTLSSYDTATVKKRLIAAAEEALADGVRTGEECDLFGNNSFYVSDETNVEIKSSENNYSYKSGAVTAHESLTRTYVETITVCGETIEFKVLGKDDTEIASIVSTYLVNVPQPNTTTTPTTYTDITYDLFLPTTIKGEGVTIEWTSANPDIMDNTGKIVAGKADKEKVTLYAAITVNGKTTTTTSTVTFAFTVTTHTHELNFYKLVQQFSPLVIYEVASDDHNTDGSNTGDGYYTYVDTGVYALPSVTTTGSDYSDYRTDYKSPKNTTNEDFLEYSAYKDIGLVSLTYTRYKATTTDTGTASIVQMSGNLVYITESALSTYTKIKVTGTFTNGDVYSTDVIVIISTGSDTTVLDTTFESVESELGTVNILKNMLASRIKSGIAGEEAYFYAPTYSHSFALSYEYGEVTYEVSSKSKTTTYTKNKNGTYTADDTATSGSGHYYKIVVDPTTFEDVETKVAVPVTVIWGTTNRTRTLYFTTPAAVHTSDFGSDASLFNSIKAQVIQQLPNDEQTAGSTGYTYGTDTVASTTGDYILVRDIVGDEKYKETYTWYGKDNDYLYSGSTTYTGCKELWIYTSTNNSDYSDSIIRDFAALITWATGKDNSKTTAASVVTNTGNLVVGNGDNSVDYGAKTADGKEYLSSDEITVLKTYYASATKKDDWDTVWESVSEEMVGYIFKDDTSAIADVVDDYVGKIDNSENDYALKYNSILQWATNFRDNEYNPGKYYPTGITVAPEQINVELAAVSYTNSVPEVGYLLNVTDVRTCIPKTVTSSNVINGKTYTSTYTCFYIDETNKRAWFYKEYILKESYHQDHKYNLTSYSVTSWYMTKSDGTSVAGSSSSPITAATGSGYTLDDWNISSYLDDDTDYITPGEAQVILAFWLKYNTISPDRGAAYIEAFFKDTTIPTYFMTDGAKRLMETFCANCDVKVSTTSKFTTSYVQPSTDGETTKNTTAGLSLTNIDMKVPTVASAENLSDALTYFTELTQVYIEGTATTPAFLSTYGLSTTGSRLRDRATGITTLVLQHVAENYVTFDLSGIKEYSKLEQIDVSDNTGISNIAPIINNMSSKYTFIDVSNLGLSSTDYKYIVQEAVTTTCVRYGNTPAVGETEGVTKAQGSGGTALSNLSDMEQLISEYGYAITTSDGETVYWRIENGNKIVSSVSADGSDVKTLTLTADEMQLLVSPYYYCTEYWKYTQTDSFTSSYITGTGHTSGSGKLVSESATEYEFYAGYIYKISYNENGTIKEIRKMYTSHIFSNETDACTHLSATETETEATGAATKTEENSLTTTNTSGSGTAVSTEYTVNGVTFKCIRLKDSDNNHTYALRLVPTYAKTTDETVTDGKTYYTCDSEQYTEVTSPTVEDIGSYYELANGVYTKTTDTTVNSSTTYYIDTSTYTQVTSPTDNDRSNYYELSVTIGRTKNSSYTGTLACIFISDYYYSTSDTSVVSGKTYYTKGDDGTYSKVTEPSTPKNNSYYEKVEGNTDDLLNYLNGDLTSGTIGTDVLNLGVEDTTKLENTYIYFPEVGYTLKAKDTSSSFLEAVAITRDSSGSSDSSDDSDDSDSASTSKKSTLEDFDFASFTYQWQTGNNCRIYFTYGATTLCLKVRGNSGGNPYSNSNSNNYYEQVDPTNLTITYSDGTKADPISNVVSYGWELVITTQNYTVTQTASVIDNSKLYGTKAGSTSVTNGVLTATINWCEEQTDVTLSDDSTKVYKFYGNCTLETAAFRKRTRTKTTYSYQFYYYVSGEETKHTLDSTDKVSYISDGSKKIYLTENDNASSSDVCVQDEFKKKIKAMTSFVTGLDSTTADGKTTYSQTTAVGAWNSESDDEKTTWTYTKTSDSDSTTATGTWGDDDKTTFVVTADSGDWTLSDTSYTWLKWTADTTNGTVNTNYMTGISGSNGEAAIKQIYNLVDGKANGTATIFVFNNEETSGTTVTEKSYTDSVTSTSQTYTNGAFYTLGYTFTATSGNDNKFGGIFRWREVAATGAEYMDNLLAEANKYFESEKYGEYYGEYVVFLGNTGTTYTNSYIYRIMPNADNSAFEFKIVTMTVDSTTKVVSDELGEVSIGSTESYTAATLYNTTPYTLAKVMYYIAHGEWPNKETNAQMKNRIIWIEKEGTTGSNSFVKTGFYKIVYDESMGTYAFKAVQNIDYEYYEYSSGDSTYYLAKLFNCRTFTVLNSKYSYTTNDKLGTGGTFTSTICAFLHEKVEVDSSKVTSESTTGTITNEYYCYSDDSGNKTYYTVVNDTYYETDENGNSTGKEVDSTIVGSLSTDTDEKKTYTYYYKAVTDGSTTTYYETDENGNYKYTDTCRYYSVDVVG